MILIEYSVFVVDSETEHLKNDQRVMHYYKKFDHSQLLKDGDSEYNRVEHMVHQWFKQHYGVIRVFFSNLSEEDACIQHTWTNRNKLIKEFERQNIKLEYE